MRVSVLLPLPANTRQKTTGAAMRVARVLVWKLMVPVDCQAVDLPSWQAQLASMWRFPTLPASFPLLAACPDPPGFDRTKYGLLPGVGRGAPEIDMVEMK
jgi:hypothetical protein